MDSYCAASCSGIRQERRCVMNHETKAAHSPEPWTYHFEEPNNEWALVMSGGKAGQIVANVNTKSCPDHASAPAFRVMPAEANVLLITAAPELLRELRSLVRYEEIRIAHLDADGVNTGPLKIELHAARVAIAKAEGRTA